MEREVIIILPRALRHGLSEDGIRCAWRNATAVRRRNFDMAEREDGAFIVYHAMRLTKKMARELEL